MTKLHLGCGPLALPGWVNIDNQRYPGVDKVRDVRKGLPYKDVSFVFAEHFIEHLAYDDALKLMRESRRVLRDSYADYLPLLSAVLEPFYTEPATVTQPHTGWQAQLVLTLPLFDGGARYGLQRERSALYAESKAQLEGLLREARSEVRTAFEEVRRADEGLSSARQAAKLAREALEMTSLAYREGATNDLEVVDAERRARDADTAALVAEDAARQARIDLLAATGRFP